jgi:uncharacterized membrane protein YhhN
VTLGLLLAAAVVGLVDWWAVAAVAGDVAGDVRVWLVVGAVFGLIGDVALMFEGEGWFIAGLGAFAVGHLAYVVAASLLEFDAVWTIPGLAFMVALLAYRFAGRTVPGAFAHGGRVLAGAVIFYAAVISAMVVTAWATTIVVAAVGAMLFAASDWVLGYRRFVGPLPGGGLAVIVPYHVGQALLVVGLAFA